MHLYCRKTDSKSSPGQAQTIKTLTLLALACLSFTWSECGGGMLGSTPARTLLSISVQPGSADATAPAGTAPFAATGTFDQSPTTQDDLTVQWSSSDPSIATIDPNNGTATCIAEGGPVTITASSSGKQGSALLHCLAAPQAGLGNCVYICGSTRCGSLSGYCSIERNNSCSQLFDPKSCPKGAPAGATATDGCGVGVDTSRSCNE